MDPVISVPESQPPIESWLGLPGAMVPVAVGVAVGLLIVFALMGVRGPRRVHRRFAAAVGALAGVAAIFGVLAARVALLKATGLSFGPGGHALTAYLLGSFAAFAGARLAAPQREPEPIPADDSWTPPDPDEALHLIAAGTGHEPVA